MTVTLERREAEDEDVASAAEEPAPVGQPESGGPTQGPLTHTQKVAWVSIIFVLLMAAGQLFAWYYGVSLAEAEQSGFVKHTVLFWQMVSAIWAATVLATAALSLYVATRSDRIDEWWRLFWTFGYAALLVHLYYSIVVNAGMDWNEIFNSPEGVGKPEHGVDHPIADCALSVVWGIDVVLAWIASAENKALRWSRALLHFAVFVMFFGAAAGSKTDPAIARGLGYGLALLVPGAALVHLVRKEVDERSLSWAIFVQFFHLLNKFMRWDSLPTFLAVPNLIAIRARLREKNLYSTSDIKTTNRERERKLEAQRPASYVGRQVDGFYNDPDKPTMGCGSRNAQDPLNPSDFDMSHPGARFGRNVPLTEAHPDMAALLEPSPRVVSTRLLARPEENGVSKVERASTLNLLAAAWIQFQTHDWFNHGAPEKDKPFEFKVDPEDTGWPEGRMEIRRTRADPTRCPNHGGPLEPPTYVNAESHWWDGSQIYGGSSELQEKYRTGRDGKLRIDPNSYTLPIETDVPNALPTSWWLGLGLMHVLFTLEHNAICDHLREQFPEWRKHPDNGDEQIFRIARLVNSALMAKIHTVEWTPAILGHPALQYTMHASWWGVAQEFITRHLGRVSDSEIISGIPGSRRDHFDVDFSLTEEFVSVYRMHPLLPEDITLRNHEDDRSIHTLLLKGEHLDDPNVATGPDAMRNARAHASFADILYTFGTDSPGALQLRNFPNWMRRMRRRHGQDEEEHIDLAAVDILRDRERGVPRYNRFRKLFHMAPKRFEEMSEDPELVRALREVYRDPDKVDLMVGMFAEKPPLGFGFSDTAFRVFILMAGRRLNSDRLFTDDYRPEIYTRAGLDWINNTTMKTMLLRHFPELTYTLRGVDNAFAPWYGKFVEKSEEKPVEIFDDERRRAVDGCRRLKL